MSVSMGFKGMVNRFLGKKIEKKNNAEVCPSECLKVERLYDVPRVLDENEDFAYKFIYGELEQKLKAREEKIIKDRTIVRVVEDKIYDDYVLNDRNGVAKVGWYPRICMRGAMEDMGFKYIGKLPSELQRWDDKEKCNIVGDVFECPQFGSGDNVRYIYATYWIEYTLGYNQYRDTHFDCECYAPLIRLDKIDYYNGAIL